MKGDIMLTDWKGNKIKAGDTVVIYRTKEQEPPSMRMAIIDFSTPDSKLIYLTPEPEKKKLKEYTWDYVNEFGPLFEMEDHDGLYFKTKVDEITCIIDIRAERFFYDDDEVICIKGKSDSE